MSDEMERSTSVNSNEYPFDEAGYREIEYLESDSAVLVPASNEPGRFRNVSGTSEYDDELNPLHSSDSRDISDFTRGSGEEQQGEKQEAENVQFSMNISAKKFRKFQFHIIGVFYARSFRSQHLSDPVYKQDVYGQTLLELHNSIWKHCINFVGREVIVSCSDNGKNVRWSSKQIPDVSDIEKYVLLKHGKTKKLYTLADIGENSKLLTKWRGSEIQVHVFKHSVSVTSNTLWDMVNKKLLHPELKDKTGAPATQEIFKCIDQLKEIHSHYTALHASWEKWANYVLAQPGDVRPKLMTDAPPDEYLHLFRSVPLSEGHHIQSTRHGLQVAYNITESVSSSIEALCNRIDSIAISVSEIQIQTHELKAQVKASRSLLDAMQASLPPEESEFSRMLASKVTDAVDVDHLE